MQAWLCAHLITTLTIYIFLLSLALGNHKGERHESIIGKAFGAVRTVEDTVTIEEPKE